MADFAPLVAFATYYTVVLEVAFPLLAASRYRAARTCALLGTVPLHLDIIPLAGLLNFGLVMIAADCLVLRDDDYRASAALLHRLWKRRRPIGDRPGTQASQAEKAILRA